MRSWDPEIGFRASLSLSDQERRPPSCKCGCGTLFIYLSRLGHAKMPAAVTGLEGSEGRGGHLAAKGDTRCVPEVTKPSWKLFAATVLALARKSILWVAAECRRPRHQGSAVRPLAAAAAKANMNAVRGLIQNS